MTKRTYMLILSSMLALLSACHDNYVDPDAPNAELENAIDQVDETDAQSKVQCLPPEKTPEGKTLFWRDDAEDVK